VNAQYSNAERCERVRKKITAIRAAAGERAAPPECTQCSLRAEKPALRVFCVQCASLPPASTSARESLPQDVASGARPAGGASGSLLQQCEVPTPSACTAAYDGLQFPMQQPPSKQHVARQRVRAHCTSGSAPLRPPLLDSLAACSRRVSISRERGASSLYVLQ